MRRQLSAATSSYVSPSIVTAGMRRCDGATAANTPVRAHASTPVCGVVTVLRPPNMRATWCQRGKNPNFPSLEGSYERHFPGEWADFRCRCAPKGEFSWQVGAGERPANTTQNQSCTEVTTILFVVAASLSQAMNALASTRTGFWYDVVVKSGERVRAYA